MKCHLCIHYSIMYISLSILCLKSLAEMRPNIFSPLHSYILNVNFSASLVFTLLSFSKIHMHTSIFARCSRAIAEGSFVSWLAKRFCAWEGMSGVNLCPAVATSIPSWSTQSSSRPLQTSSVTLNYLQFPKLPNSLKIPSKDWSSYRICNLFDRVWCWLDAISRTKSDSIWTVLLVS